MTDLDASAANARVRDTLSELIVPMVISLLIVGSVALVDTMYLSILGDRALTAFSFMIPILSGVNQLSLGFGIGVTSTISRALGARDHGGAARLVAHTCVLSAVGAVLLTSALFAFQDPLFRALGASELELPLIHAFMRWWTPCGGLVLLVGWGTAVLRAFGETRSTALVMLLQAGLNAVVAPFLIFGPGSQLTHGMRGAGLALLLACSVSASLTLLLLYRKRARVRFALTPSGLPASTRATMAVAIPAIATYVLVPATIALFTHRLAGFGSDAVAAFGVAARFEGFIVMVPLGVGAGLSPFVGQHWGAGKLDELRYATSWCLRVVRLWGLGVAVLLAALAVPIGKAMADTPELAAKIAAALWIMPLGYASYGAIVIASSVYNSVGQALRTMGFAALRTIALAIPLGALGDQLCGVFGIYAALPLASLLTERHAAHRLRKDGLVVDRPESAQRACETVPGNAA